MPPLNAPPPNAQQSADRTAAVAWLRTGELDAGEAAADAGSTARAPAPAVETELLHAMLSLVLEGTAGNLLTAAYYRKAARHAQEHDPVLVSMLADMVAWVRNKYRSARQHDYHAQRVPVTKTVDRRVRAQLDGDCAICLRSLRAAGHRLVRLKPASCQPGECGHFFHKDCIGEWELRHLVTPKSCPLCRANLGLVVQTWEDHESHQPLF